ncbi:MAG: PP2C family protein-serine/threonine phosphatase [Armatimonadota bacterium]
MLIPLAAAALVDYGSGVWVVASAFYIFPIARAGFLAGLRGALAVTILATLLNATTEWIQRTEAALTVSPEILLANELLSTVVFLAVAYGSASVARRQQLVLEQKEELEAVNRRLENDLNDTRKLQDLLMSPPPPVPGLELGLYLKPARIVGGDAAQLSPENGHLVIIIADVSGKGPPAALAGAVLIGLLDHAPSRTESPARALAEVNARLVERFPDELFVTVFYGLLHCATGELRYASAGHDPQLLLRADGTHEQLMPTAMPLGVIPELDAEEVCVTLETGDLLLGYTDGATDVPLPGGGRLEEAGLAERLLRHRQLPPQQLVEQVAAGLLELAPEPPDDITLVAVRRLP